MNKQIFKDTIGWGVALWLIGYVLGIVLFPVVAPSMIGWVIMPIGIAVTLWALFKKVKSESFKDYFLIAFVWTLLAIILDYLFLVMVFKPVDGYYKLDVYLYYVLTFVLPIVVGWYRSQQKNIDLRQ